MINKEQLECTSLQKFDSRTTSSQLQVQRKYRLNDAEPLAQQFKKESWRTHQSLRSSQILKEENIQFTMIGENFLSLVELQQTSSVFVGPSIKFDMAILQLNNEKRQYSAVILKETCSQGLIEQISQLIISHLQQHVKLINLNEVEENTKNPSKVSKPLVIPLVGGQKTTFVYSSHQYLKNGAFYEQSQKFYIFICQEFLPFSFANMAKYITNLQFEDRIRLDGGKYGLNYYTSNLLSRKGLLNVFDEYLSFAQIYQFSNTKNIRNQKLCQLQWYLKHVYDHKIRIKTNSKKLVEISLFTFVLYFSLKDYKVIMIGKEDTNSIMSEIFVALKTCLLPIQYSNPGIFAVISQIHKNYLDVPMPSFICLWGDQSNCDQLIKQRRQILDSSSRYQTPTVIIDMNQKMGITKVDVKQIECLRRMDYLMKNGLNYVNEEQKENNRIKLVNSTVDKAHYFIFCSLIGGQNPEFEQLANQFRNSTIYCNHHNECKSTT